MEEWFADLHEQGYRASVVSVTHLPDLREGIEGPRREGLLDAALGRQYLDAFRFCPPDDLQDARSVIVVAVPQPAVRFTFHRQGAPRHAVVPPTYLHAARIDEQVRALLAGTLAPAGYRVALATLPKKLLAVRSGLAAYGRNNVTYIPGLGSFHRLVAFYSDLPCPEDRWQAVRMMERCESCTACLHHCPAGAIVADRFLIHAERCLTFHNEQPAHASFADWIDPAWHNAIVGCMHCQRVCPANRDLLGCLEEGTMFSEQETDLLLEGVALERLPSELAEKLHRSDLMRLTDVLTRNLRMLLPDSRIETGD